MAILVCKHTGYKTGCPNCAFLEERERCYVGEQGYWCFGHGQTVSKCLRGIFPASVPDPSFDFIAGGN